MHRLLSSHCHYCQRGLLGKLKEFTKRTVNSQKSDKTGTFKILCVHTAIFGRSNLDKYTNKQLNTFYIHQQAILLHLFQIRLVHVAIHNFTV